MLEAAYERYRAIPEAMRALPNWCIAGPDKAPYTYNSSGWHEASNRKPEHWLTFDKAIEGMVATNAPAIGFVCSAEAGITCIDLDVKDAENAPDTPAKWTKPEDIARFAKIVEVFDTYSERSIGGKGAHLWLFGSIGKGAKRDGVEVYSQERFMVCTGDVFINKPMAKNDDMLAMLVEEVRRSNPKENFQLVEVEPTEDDLVVYTRASEAANADKFNKLWNGEWVGDYPSQSEADLSLMSMFTFYSESNSQCRRLFRQSGLGRREKATKNDRYLNFTLEIIRGRQQREKIMDAHGEEMARNLVKQLQGTTAADTMAAAAVASQPLPEVAGTIEWPPGLAGQIAGHIYHSSARPVKEVAILATMGFLAGVTGRAFNYNSTGLNLYMVLVARSGVGKEAMHSGISSILQTLREVNPAAQTFVDFTEFASGQGLLKACSVMNSFVNVSGEWGRKLQRMSLDDRPDSPMSSLRTQMTNLFQKSGKGMMVGGIGYSNTEQSFALSTGTAYSMIGETTPDTFYRSLTQSMMEDGFLSRFVIIEYDGDRPPSNPNMGAPMHNALKQSVSALCSQAITNNSRSHAEDVQSTPEAASMLANFDLECDARINSSKDESVRQMWNRAHLKACRMASILAVADNWITPVISETHAQWALDVVKRDIKSMSTRMGEGDVGQGDDYTRYLKMMSVVKEYFTQDNPPKSYDVNHEMREVGIVPHRYMQLRCSQLAQFRSSRQGSKIAIDNTIKSLLDNGYIQEVSRETMVKSFAFAGKAYRIISYPK